MVEQIINRAVQALVIVVVVWVCGVTGTAVAQDNSNRANNPFAPSATAKKPAKRKISSSNDVNNPFAPSSENSSSPSNRSSRSSRTPANRRAGDSPIRNRAPAAAAADKRARVYVRHDVTDPGMEIVAYSAFYPEGWEVEGGLTRPADELWFNPVIVDVLFTAPDGRQLHFYPSMCFEYSHDARDQGAKPLDPVNGGFYFPLPESPSSFVEEMKLNYSDSKITNLSVVSEEPDPDMTRALKKQSAAMYESVRQGIGQAFDTQATVVNIRYTRQGKEIEESILIAWQYYAANGKVTWSISQMISMAGPVGSDYTNDPDLLTILQSARVNPQWNTEMNKYWQKLAGILEDGRRQRELDWQAHNAKMQQYRAETNAIIVGGYARRTAIRDAGFEKVIDGIHEVSPYNVGGDIVKIPNYYENVYSDGADRLILTNDFNYDPNQDLNQTGNWTRVEQGR